VRGGQLEPDAEQLGAVLRGYARLGPTPDNHPMVGTPTAWVCPHNKTVKTTSSPHLLPGIRCEPVHWVTYEAEEPMLVEHHPSY
jgi:hypothetical protein